MKTFIQRFAHDERGITAIEYGLIAGIMALGIITAATALSTGLGTTFTNIVTILTTHSAS
jgi:pilus assembly protein Flp/PilA